MNSGANKFNRNSLLLFYAVICLNIFLWVPWNQRNNSEILHNSSLGTLNYIRNIKVACILLLLYITIPSLLRFFSKHLFNVVNYKTFYKEIFTSSIFFISTLYILIQNIYLGASAYNYYNLCLVISMFSTSSWIYYKYNTPEEREKAFSMITKTVFYFSLLILMVYFKNPSSLTIISGDVSRLGSTIISPNHIADFGAFILLYSLYRKFCNEIESNKFDIIVILIGTCIILLSRSAGAIFSTSVSIFVLVFVGPQKFLKFYIFGVIIFLCSAFFIDPILNFVLRNISVSDYLIKSTLTDRIDLWKFALNKLGNENILFGFGSGLDSIHFFSNSSQWGASFAHNYFIQTLVEGGILYLLIITFFVFGFLLDAKKIYKNQSDKIGIFMLCCWSYSFLRALVGGGFTGSRTPFICILFYLSIYQAETFSAKFFLKHHPESITFSY